MKFQTSKSINRREAGNNIWLGKDDLRVQEIFSAPDVAEYKFEILESEEAIGQAMFEELQTAVAEKNGEDLVMLLLGGRGAQAMYRIIGEKSKTDEIDALLGKLHVFTQDALAPMAMKNSLSFVRDFERLLGDAFFQKIKLSI